MKSIGIDVGTDSLGIAWVDTETHEIVADVRIFTAGIDEKKNPRNLQRRRARALRRLLRRRAKRKAELRKLLKQYNFLPTEPGELSRAFGEHKRDEESGYDPELINPWKLRAEALDRRLTPYELGRVFTHLNQRRGYRESDEERERRQLKEESASDDAGSNGDRHDAKRRKKNDGQVDDEDSGKVKEGLSRLDRDMKKVAVELNLPLDRLTLGRFMAHRLFGPACTISLEGGASYRNPIRNRLDSHTYHAPRELVVREFHTICDAQAKSFGHSQLSTGNPVRDAIEQLIFFQRRTYWKRSSLRRCDLVPTDERVLKADRYAQEFRLLETVNRMRIGRGSDKRPLDIADPRRETVLDCLTSQSRVTITTLLEKLDLTRGAINLEDEKGDKLPINSDWFSVAVIRGVFGQETWTNLPARQQDSVNRAIQTFAFERPDSESKLRRLGNDQWGLTHDQQDKLVAAWRDRPAGRVAFSRRALVEILLPRMRQGMDVESARLDATRGKGSAPSRKMKRYKGNRKLASRKPLPPPPDLPNPVVRRALHVVRRYVNAYIREKGMPDQIVVELTRRARQTERARQEQHQHNQELSARREIIVESYKLADLYTDGRARMQAIRRMELYQQQKFACPYCGVALSKENVSAIAQDSRTPARAQ